VTTSTPTRRPPAHVPPEPDPDPDAKGSLRPWTVVTIWAVLLGLLASVSAGFGNNLVVLAISGSAAMLILILAGTVWLDHHFRPYRTVFGLPARLGGGFLFAVTAVTAWTSLAFGEVMLLLAVVPFVGGVGLHIAAWRHRR
jgi:predicted lysophospholipase L1 biosynthesis ABC-type transport system permease subunit